METKTQGVIQGYNPQIAVDSDHGIIIGLQMSNSSSDQQQFQGSVEANTGRMPKKASADAGNFSADNIKAADKAKVTFALPEKS
ncbi:transposase [Aneurinibacillus terranovensis]|uniref:transposase n=1 Tax=Aneurinibacillus terranovensis TaxID=278991 RepID=UPI000404223B|nr:transposase [Aneurinibacillus terranovensis]